MISYTSGLEISTGEVLAHPEGSVLIMKHLKKISGFVAFVLLCLLLLPKEAHAYIDPATGSYITQIIIAALVGGLFVIKQYYARIKAFIDSLSSKKKK